MSVHLATLKHIQIAIIEPQQSFTGSIETDELKVCAKDLIKQGNRFLILDLSKVTRINSIVCHTMLNVYNLYDKKDGQVVLCGIEKNVQNLFSIPRLASIFDIVEDKQGALKIFESYTTNN